MEKLVEQFKEDIDSTPHIRGPESQLVTESVVWSGRILRVHIREDLVFFCRPTETT